VIDTIGFNNKSYGDNFRTPHGDKLYVVERWRLPTTRPCGQGRFLGAPTLLVKHVKGRSPNAA